MVSRRGWRTWALIGVLATVVAVPLAAVLVSPTLAVLVLALAVALAGGFRAVAPEDAIPGGRSRTFDVVFLLALAVSLGYLSRWADATSSG
ncbi:hypothetical protein [Georgenia alba]|uniref:DUF3017 domain-containing protein n=1 Tax=Georgenia alba TaxID=2233858 RepID=A0ABW2QAL2_9MICO